MKTRGLNPLKIEKGGKENKCWNPKTRGSLYHSQSVTFSAVCGGEEEYHWVDFLCETCKERKGNLKWLLRCQRSMRRRKRGETAGQSASWRKLRLERKDRAANIRGYSLLEFISLDISACNEGREYARLVSFGVLDLKEVPMAVDTESRTLRAWSSF